MLEDGIFVAPGERHGTPAPEGSQVTVHQRGETSHVRGRGRWPSWRGEERTSPVFVSAGYREGSLRSMGWKLMAYANDGIL